MVRDWICTEEMCILIFVSRMSYLLSTEFEPRAHGPNVDMRAGGFAGDCMAEGEIRNLVVDQILEQPVAFGLIGVDGHVNAAAVIETERPVHGGLAHGADGERLAEALFEIAFH